jgi:hypothetical protein
MISVDSVRFSSQMPECIVSLRCVDECVIVDDVMLSYERVRSLLATEEEEPTSCTDEPYRALTLAQNTSSSIHIHLGVITIQVVVTSPGPKSLRTYL